MVDIVDRATRSRMMSGIKGKNTKPELIVRSYLHRCGLRFRLHDRRLPGKPDLVLRRHRAVVHVHGCFWHQHEDCQFAYMPKSNRQFWKDKLKGSEGWRVFTIWECEAADKRVLRRLSRSILNHR
jgi:DNA mismatch endonuclease, patch repair protein